MSHEATPVHSRATSAQLNPRTLSRAAVLILAIAAAACGGGGDSGGSGKACTSSSDCSGGICIKLGASSTCHLKCKVTGSSCSGSATCNDVGLLGVNFCDERPAPTPSSPPKPQDEPKIPCSSDQECKALSPKGICVTWKGFRECTVRCTGDQQCKMPSVGGMSVDFSRCLPDEANKERKGCLSREECFTNPMSCVKLPSIGKDGGSLFPEWGI